MTNNTTKTQAGHARRGTCAITGREASLRDLIPLDAMRPALSERILADHPGLEPHALVGRDEVARYRARYVEDLLKDERGEVSELDRQVSESLATRETLRPRAGAGNTPWRASAFAEKAIDRRAHVRALLSASAERASSSASASTSPPGHADTSMPQPD